MGRDIVLWAVGILAMRAWPSVSPARHLRQPRHQVVTTSRAALETTWDHTAYTDRLAVLVAVHPSAEPSAQDQEPRLTCAAVRCERL